MLKNALLLVFLCIGTCAVCQDFQRFKTLPPFSLGVVDTVYSGVLQEKRVLNIYLPGGYSPDSAAQYPVIYLLDGSADEDFIHVAGLVQFYNFPWINVLPKSIVVGIANVDRERDFTFPTTIQKDKLAHPTTGGSANFITFLEKELQPHLDKHYKTNQTRMLIGQSLGGLLATEILYKKPQLFTHYMIVSPSLWWDQESLLRLRPAPGSAKIFVAVGKEGKIMERDSKNLFKNLKAVMQDKQAIHFNFLKDKNHATILHQALCNGFEVLK